MRQQRLYCVFLDLISLRCFESTCTVARNTGRSELLDIAICRRPQSAYNRRHLLNLRLYCELKCVNLPAHHHRCSHGHEGSDAEAAGYSALAVKGIPRRLEWIAIWDGRGLRRTIVGRQLSRSAEPLPPTHRRPTSPTCATNVKLSCRSARCFG
jgi:hypothetical protein